MAEPQSKVREVAWSELFPWLLLLRTVRIALLARVLILGALGLVATTAGWRLISDLFLNSTDPVVMAWRPNTNLQIWMNAVHQHGNPIWVNPAPGNAIELFDSARSWLIQAPVMIWTYFTRPWVSMFDSRLSPTGFLFLLLCGIWELLVWGLIGGAITRIAALKFTRDEAPGLIAALRHAVSKWPSYSLPPLVAMAGAAVFGIQLLILGWIMRLDALAFVAAIFWPFVILLGLMMAILLIGALVGWPLMWSTVSVEGTDAFDALSRSYAYVYHRPWRLLWYVLFAFFLAVVSMFVVKVFASSAIALGNWSIDWGLDDESMRTVVAPRPTTPSATPTVNAAPTAGDLTSGDIPDVAADENSEGLPETSMLRGARHVIDFWKAVVALLVAGYQAGFLWVAAVGIYLLLRRDIDGVQTAEVFVDHAEEYGMPPLAADGATGVPEVAPHEPALPGNTEPAGP
jgi:hypothetical protein